MVNDTEKDKLSSIRTDLKTRINEFRDLLGRLEKVVAEEVGGRLNPSQREEVSEALFMGIVYPGTQLIEKLESILKDLTELDGRPGFMGVREGGSTSNPTIKVGDIVMTPKGEGRVVGAGRGLVTVFSDEFGELLFSEYALTKIKSKGENVCRP